MISFGLTMVLGFGLLVDARKYVLLRQAFLTGGP
jgi:hypothetical protein